jgi:hypothetical protein
MSETLIVHICKGPERIDNKASITKAKKHIEEVVKAAKFARKRLEEDKEDVLDRMEKEKHPITQLLEPMMKHNQFSTYREAEITLEYMECTKPAKFIKEFVAWWNRGDGNDTSWRMDPDNRKRKIVVCGAATYGDSPDGYGFNLMQEAWNFDLPHRLGIK